MLPAVKCRACSDVWKDRKPTGGKRDMIPLARHYDPDLTICYSPNEYGSNPLTAMMNQAAGAICGSFV